jgi:hypothetical protein
MFLTLLIQLSEACTIACKDQKKTNSSEEHIIIRQKKKKKKSFENPEVARYLPG